jgi:hypothetical protein
LEEKVGGFPLGEESFLLIESDLGIVAFEEFEEGFRF